MRSLRALGWLALAASIAAGPAAARSSAAGTHLTFDALVSKAQFVNNRDDRQRGTGKNPFGNAGGTGTATTNERGRGPLPGDEGLFAYALTATGRHTSLGTGDLVCEYTFDKVGSCSFTYALAGGTIVGAGAVPALARSSFDLTVTGGTGSYRGVRGTVHVTKGSSTALPSKTVSHNVPALLLEPERVSVSLTAPARARPVTLVRYSSATEEQFIDNGDDEVRGWSTNPFGMRDPQQEALEDADTGGPFPGDESLFGFAIRTQPTAAIVNPASYTCLYSFAKRAFCDASIRLPGGTLFGAGSFLFAATRYSIAITGGTGDFLGASGELDSVPGPHGTQRVTIHLAWPARRSQHRFTYWSKATAEQFVNNADDRLRGKGKNPFGNFHDSTPTTKQSKGPFPGDEDVYTFDVYGSAAQGRPIGTATYTCLFDFADHVYCDARYHLPRGDVQASGAFDFSATSFTLVATGGSGAYAGATGTIAVSPAAHDGQRLAFSMGNSS